MYIYHIEMAPIFLQIIGDREAEQNEILRNKGETFEGKAPAKTPPNGGRDKEERAGRALQSLLAARHRIESNSYGKCKACATAIDLQRLIALPAAPFCLTCENKHDRKTAQANSSHKLHREQGEAVRSGGYASEMGLNVVQSEASIVEEV